MRSKNSDVIDVGGPSSSSAPESSPSSRGHQTNGGDLLLQWIDHYEEAVTNHYSPELRARVSSVRTNGLGGELLLPPSACSVYRLASKAGGFKVSIYHLNTFFVFQNRHLILIFFSPFHQDTGCLFTHQLWLTGYRMPWQVHAGQPIEAL
jgi:hypothetical protein